MSDSMTTRTIEIPGHDGDQIEAYLAEPTETTTPRGGVVVIHHMPGYDRAMKEITRRIAELGYNTIMPNLYFREAPGAAPDDAYAVVRADGGVSDEQVIGDVAGAAAYLRALATSNGKAGCIGFCSGGRQTVASACSTDLDAAVDCYGGAVIRPPGARMPRMVSLVPLLASLRAPLLGLFGNDDQFPTPDEVNEFETILTENGKTYEFHRYDGAGHAFLSSDRPSYRVEAANDGWERIANFYTRHLS
jgi:carboxymethylenebutenolidase